MTEYMQCLAVWTPGPFEMLIIAVVALLLFGRRLPEIARNIGKSLTEFKKGINEGKQIKDDVESDVRQVKNEVAKDIRDASGIDDVNKS